MPLLYEQVLICDGRESRYTEETSSPRYRPQARNACFCEAVRLVSSDRVVSPGPISAPSVLRASVVSSSQTRGGSREMWATGRSLPEAEEMRPLNAEEEEHEARRTVRAIRAQINSEMFAFRCTQKMDEGEITDERRGKLHSYKIYLRDQIAKLESCLAAPWCSLSMQADYEEDIDFLKGCQKKLKQYCILRCIE